MHIGRDSFVDARLGMPTYRGTKRNHKLVRTDARFWTVKASEPTPFHPDWPGVRPRAGDGAPGEGSSRAPRP